MPEMPALSSARVAALVGALLAPAAFAHPGHGDGHDFLGGVLNPVVGLEHALAMLTLGMLLGFALAAAVSRLRDSRATLPARP